MSVADRGKSRLSIILDHYNFKSYVNTIGREQLLKGVAPRGESPVISQERFGEISDSLFSMSNSPIYTNEFISDDKFGNVSDLGNSLQITFENTNNLTSGTIISENMLGQVAVLGGSSLLNLTLNTFSSSFINAFNVDANREILVKRKLQGFLPNTEQVARPFSIKKMLGMEENPIINVNPNSKPTKRTPHLASYQIFDEALAIGNRQTLELSAFFNLIPTIELSRAVPIISAKFSLPKSISREVSGVRDEFSVANNADFLFGSSSPNAKRTMDAYRGDIFTKTIESQRSGNRAEKLGINSNLDIFLSPQTLVNANEEYTGLDSEYTTAARNKIGRSNPVIDKMRPFMSIESFDIDVKPTRGLLSYKTAQLNLVLHDRSRMIDIAPFIKPDLFGAFGSEISVEYGWAHPDGSNPYGAMLNLFRAIEKYMIVNSSFSLQQTGEVKISLSLAMLGATDIVNKNIFANDEIKSALESFNNELSAFRETIASGQPSEGDNNSLTRPDTASIQQATQVANNANDGNKLSESLDRFIRRANSGPYGIQLERSAKRLQEALEGLKGAKAAIFDSVEKIVELEYDPYLSYEILRKLEIVNSSGQVTDRGGPRNNSRKISDYISFGKLIMGVIGKDLALTGRFNEVQVIFYNTNNKCGRASAINLANLPIRKAVLKSYLESYINKEISTMSIGNLILALSKRFIENKASLIYGFEGIFEYDSDTGGTKTGENFSVAEATASQKEILYKTYFGNGEYNILKRALGKEPGDLDANERRALLRKVDFIETKVGFSTEVIYRSDQKRLNKTNVTPEPEFSFKSSGQEDDTILRVHVFDKSNTPFQGAYDFLSSVINDDVRSIQDILNIERPDLAGTSARQNIQAFNKALRDNLKVLVGEISNAEENSQIKISSKFGAIKETYKKIMPSLTYGSQNSAIINATFQTINEGRLPTVFITRAERELDADNQRESGAIKISADHLPVRVLPTKVDLTTFGCPIINFAQSLFLDFGTGTTIDNLYNVTGIKHTITQGKFESGITLQYGDIYGKFESRYITEAKLDDVLQKIQNNIETANQRRLANRRARQRSAARQRQRNRRAGRPNFVRVDFWSL